jgi:hypothetical protein
MYTNRDADIPHIEESQVYVLTPGSLVNGTDDLNITYLVSYKCEYCTFELAKKAELVVHMDGMHFSLPLM